MTASSHARESLLIELSRSITEDTLAGVPELAVVQGVCDRLVAGGVPLSRMIVGVDTLHPLVGGRLYTWRRDVGIECVEITREASLPNAPLWVASPFHHLLAGNESLYRFRCPPADGRYPFAVLAELAATGITDYIACVHRLGDAVKMGELDCVYSSWGSDAPAGFTEADVALVAALGPFLAAAMLSCTVRQITRTVVETYLGGDAGGRVLRGAIARGVAERIRAVVWFSDLKGFTSMVDSTDAELVLPLLNDYADPQVEAIHAHGGTVLKFIGDGLLGMFPVGDSTAEAASRALAAADAVFTTLAEVSARRVAAGLPATGAYLALHLGDVFYGNIGGAARLDFTVIGPAVNEAARIGAMCRPLAQDVLVSQAFADALPAARTRLVALGSHRLRGVAQAQALYAVVPAVSVPRTAS
ncbi:adenylate/guanylate cyclase domain-containing protein [Nannocystis pusilla]|uniref:Adenylate/guanylate cyclase domain-containing protein n=1 Tax=Nannocystis pusilla TaxID=889268 RepID=A0A9X3J3D4_9BACT|nr:adenylate/guanylate cyclase domain-containing protein [Nannocystis pusilla]MCY1013646.1 adenylate/guanylate cyclase domain-containing protein [Nannocystis pusilla]